MVPLNVTVTPQQRRWIRERVADGSFASESDYVSDLIRRDQDHARSRAANLESLDASLSRAVKEADDRDVLDLDAVCRELEAKYGAMPTDRNGD